MKTKLFKLVPVSRKEILADTKQPFVLVWNLKPDGFIVSPSSTIPSDWARHTDKGSAAVFNVDNLIQQVASAPHEK